MKQRITVEQLNELTEGQKEKLREWWRPTYGDLAVSNHYQDKPFSVPKEPFAKEICTPLLTVGQMIELLLMKGANKYPTIQDYNSDALVAVNIKEYIEEVDECLCDALWKVIKKTLE